MINYPDDLKIGDTVWVVSPSYAPDNEKLSQGIETLKSWGLIVKMGSAATCNDHLPFGGSDAQRCADLQKALDDYNAKAIFMSRGGYGMGKIIDQLNLAQFLKRPKWIVGYSDITTLLSHLFVHGCSSIHSIMPAGFHKEGIGESISSLKDLLFGKEVVLGFPRSNYNKGGNVRGKLIGGNLSILTNLIGTRSDIDFEGKVLFIEEVGEPLYKIDRMLLQLKRSGKLGQLKGLLIGQFTELGGNDMYIHKNVEELILSYVQEYSYPVVFNFPAGHDVPNMPLMIGAEIEVAKSGDKIVYKQLKRQ